MKLYFEEPHHRDLLFEQIEAWNNVPYEHMGETKSGVDCSKLLGQILFAMGVLKGNLEKVYKAPDWMLSGKQEVLLDFVNETLKEYLNKKDFYFSKIKAPLKELYFGDFLFFSLVKSGVTNHAAIYLGEDKIFHCLTKQKCCIDQLSFSWRKRITQVYRLKLWQ